MSEDNTYLLNPEAEEEMIRLALQGRLITHIIRLLPPNLDLFQLPSMRAEETRAPQILDLGCATGEWGLALVSKYRHVQVTGIDISERMIAYARKQSENQELENAHFQVGNALARLPFSDESFDLINLRMANGFIPRTRWTDVFRECWRVLRPRGILVSSEGEIGTTTFHNPATAQIQRWLAQAHSISNLGFWDGVGSHTGIHAMQPDFFTAAGFDDIEIFPYIAFSSQIWFESVKTMVQGVEPLIVGKLGVAKEEFHRVCEMSRLEELQDTYRFYNTYVSVTGNKRGTIE